MTATPLDLKSTHAADVLIVEAMGEVDMATAPVLAEALEATTDTTRRVVVILSEVTFLDSSALNALVHSRRTLAERKVTMRVVAPADKAVRRIFEITNLTDELGVVDSLPEALG